MTQTYRKFPYGSFVPYYANGLLISNNATTPNTKLDVGTGTMLDSTGTFQVGLDAAVTINAANVGLNGIDTGVLEASKVYAVYIVCDPVSLQPSGAMISLSYTQPYLPTGYGFFALVGFVTTDATVHFLKGYWSAGNSARRTFTYDAPIIALTAGASTSYAGVALTAFVPAVNNTNVTTYMLFAANAAGNVANLQSYNGVGDQVSLIAPVATGVANTTEIVNVLAQLNTTAPSIKYKVSAGALSLYVNGYEFNI